MTISNRLFRRLIVALVLLGLLALAAASALALHVVLDSQADTVWVNHTAQVERALFQQRLALERLETARRGLLLQPEPRFLEVYREMRAALPRLVEQTAALTLDNPVHRQEVAQVRARQARQIVLTDRTVALVLADQLQAARDGFATDGSVPGMRQLRRDLERMSATEVSLMTVRAAAQRAAGQRLRAVLIGTGVLLVLVALSVIWLILRNSRDLDAAAAKLRG